jgi:4-alpha-glucanotransferase
VRRDGGEDAAELEALGLAGDGSGDEFFRRRLIETTDARPDAPVDDVVAAAHRELALAPSQIRLATLEDALGVERRPNVPGTVTERPNWRLPLPKPLDRLEHDPLLRRVASAMEAGAERQARAAPAGGDSEADR